MKIDSSDHVSKLSKHPEDAIVMSVVDRLGIKHCIHIKDASYSENDFVNLKEFFNKNLMVIVGDYGRLNEYLKTGSFLNVKTMIVVKGKNLVKMVELFEDLENVSLFVFK